MKVAKVAKAGEKLIFLKQEGNREREDRMKVKRRKDSDGERRTQAVGGENRGVSKEAGIGGNKDGEGREADRDRWME